MTTFKKSKLVKMAKKNTILVTFTKINGDERLMRCTLNPVILENVGAFQDSQSERPMNPDVLPVWDLDKEAWRSFRIDSVKDVGFVS